MATITGAISSNYHLPTVQLAHGVIAPCPTTGSAGKCSENWIPAGPAMDTLLNTIFTDETAEFTDIQSTSPSIDLTDWQLTPDLLSTFTTSSNFYITQAISEHGYFEIEFMLANNFWGCNMQFGNSQCGTLIRQGISHLLDKVKFSNGEPSIAGTAAALDNPVPSSAGLSPANPCNWDNGPIPSSLTPVLGASFRSHYPADGTAPCVVGSAAGTAYHLAAASGATSVWQPSISDLDFCAAAAYFIDAGLATGVVNPSTSASTRNCTLTGLTFTPGPPAPFQVEFFVRQDNTPRLHLGDSLAQMICALFGEGYNTGCAALKVDHGPITGFPGFTTSTTTVDLNFGLYTAAFGNVFPFDSSLYLGYSSRFVSGISSIKGGTPTAPCSSLAVPTASAGNYMYMCNTAYDSLANSMEFAPATALTSSDCNSPTGTDPTPGTSGQPVSAVNGSCQGRLDAISAGYQAEDLFGRGAYTFPIFGASDQFGYLQHTPGNTAATWQRVINHEGNGIANFFTWLNAWNSNPTQTGTIREAFKQGIRSASPYIASTVWDFYIVGDIYDSLHIVDPLNNGLDLSWMDVSTIKIPPSGLSYTPPTGTVLAYRMTLWPGLTWQDSSPVTSFDVAYSYLTLLANGAFQSGGASPLAGVTILSPNTFDLDVNNVGPFTRLFVTGLSIFPGKYWTCGTGTQPSTGSAPNIIPAPCTVPATVAQNQWSNAVTAATNCGAACYPVQYALGTAPLASACYPNASLPCSPPAQCNTGTGLSVTGCDTSHFPARLLNADATKVTATFDPIANHILIGSSAWTCGTGTGLGQACAPGNVQSIGVGQSFTLQRNGKGIAPSFPGDYFRSSGNLALWLWAGGPNLSSNWFSIAKSCFGAAPVTLGSTPTVSSCAHWQQGIGTSGATTAPGVGGCPSGTTPCGISVGTNQLSIVKLYSVPVDWLGSATGSASTWNTTPPQGIIALDPLLYEGNAPNPLPAGYPGFTPGGVQTLSSTSGCGSAYPAGQYDC